MKKSAVKKTRGSIILPVAFSMLVGFILLGAVQLGYYFYMKLEMQNAADLAALSGVQLLSDGDTQLDDCEKAEAVGKASARKNVERHGELLDDQLVVVCGTWDETVEDVTHFMPVADTNGKFNALRVTIQYNVLPFVPFSSATDIAVEAIAKKSALPVAAFSVGPALLSFENGLLTNLLEVAGLTLTGTEVASFKGLADVNIKPSGLLEQLDIEIPANITVAELNSLLSADTSVKALYKIVDASVKAVTSRELTDAELAVLAKLSAALKTKGVTIPIGSNNGQRGGLFAHIVAPSAKAALDTEVGLGDILNVVLAAATKGRAVDLPLAVEIPGLLKVDGKIGIIEPPSIGLGTTGATAHSASVRAFLRWCVDLEQACSDTSAGFESGLFDLKVDIPVGVEVVAGTATLGPML